MTSPHGLVDDSRGPRREALVERFRSIYGRPPNEHDLQRLEDARQRLVLRLPKKARRHRSPLVASW